ncbi:photosystem II oxygen evolving complex protein PsbP [Thalassoporum mexicanum PCC 7367]|uniref:photosystem II reaction center PsbP n=1 Tax=Thalassoporum mexicanum TaxID=3457544 RepID=UPI00029FB12C|nr:photosystem II reaction center PsbP [Pseudanabaena sp. PCC 7367]AFY68498.1 photosystem II oxygen evolving complex protein PsbP [Pseudanabaena sp. PCC 7367]
MLKRAVCLLLIVLTIGLSGCVSKAGGLVPYNDSKDGYSFLYPNGWLETRVPGGPDILFHDLIEQSESVSVIISGLKSVNHLTEIGSAKDVGEKIKTNMIALPGTDREAKLVRAQQREANDKTYYLLEYVVNEANTSLRHDLLSITDSNDRLYALSISTLDQRWDKVKDMFYNMASSFAVK